MTADFFDCAELLLNQGHGAPTAWGNLGDWSRAVDYPSACAALARRLADAVELRAADRVLDLGFGMGEQLRLWQQHYGVTQLIGLNPSRSQLDYALARVDAGYSLHRAGAEQLTEYCEPRSRSVVLALDCAYHFPDRAQVFADICRSLQPGGRLALTDLLLPDRKVGSVARLALRGLCRASHIPVENMQSWAQYRAQLLQLGFLEPRMQDLSAQVFAPFARWWRGYRRQVPRGSRRKFDLSAAALNWLTRQDQLRYALITARVQGVGS